MFVRQMPTLFYQMDPTACDDVGQLLRDLSTRLTEGANVLR